MVNVILKFGEWLAGAFFADVEFFLYLVCGFASRENADTRPWPPAKIDTNLDLLKPEFAKRGNPDAMPRWRGVAPNPLIPNL